MRVRSKLKKKIRFCLGIRFDYQKAVIEPWGDAQKSAPSDILTPASSEHIWKLASKNGSDVLSMLQAWKSNSIPGREGFSAIPGREGIYCFTQPYSSYLAVGDACKN